MLSRATSMPASISAVICSWLEVAGPRVQTIFARRLILHPLPVVYTTLAHPGRRVTGVTKCSPGVPRGGRDGVLRADPAVVAGRPGAVRALPGQDRVDEADEVGVLLRDRQAVRLVGQLGAHDLGERVLRRAPVEE